MIVDTSAIAAILFEEPEAQGFRLAMSDAPSCRMSVATYLEAAIVVESRGGAQGARDLAQFMERSAIELVPVTVEQAEAARDAWRRFGKGNHPARLNFGDCFAYALAATVGEPLLCKGKDFALTDIELVWRPDQADVAD